MSTKIGTVVIYSHSKLVLKYLGMYIKISLRFTVQKLGFTVLKLGFTVQEVGFAVLDLGFAVQIQ